MLQAPERFVFANQLRGIAALCVVGAHLAGVYWAGPNDVADATFSISRHGAPPPFYALFSAPWFNFGPFGVALFFLISGFVIPFSLQRQNPAVFLIQRFFRIFPTYWLAFSIELAVIFLSAAYWHRPFTDSGVAIAANALLATDIVNVPSIDLVNWTLMVELKFYLLMALLAAGLRRGSLIALAGTAACVLLVSKFSREIFLALPGLGNALRIFESNALFIIFMLIGVAFSYHARNLIGNRRLCATVLLLFAAFVACWPLTFFRAVFPLATINYAYALAVFGALYAFRRRVLDTPVLDYLAAISYPLYLVHALVGFSIMQILIADRVDPTVATIAALVLTMALATAIHFAIELPSQRFGHALARRLTPVPRPEPAAELTSVQAAVE